MKWQTLFSEKNKMSSEIFKHSIYGFVLSLKPFLFYLVLSIKTDLCFLWKHFLIKFLLVFIIIEVLDQSVKFLNDTFVDKLN